MLLGFSVWLLVNPESFSTFILQANDKINDTLNTDFSNDIEEIVSKVDGALYFCIAVG